MFGKSEEEVKVIVKLIKEDFEEKISRLDSEKWTLTRDIRELKEAHVYPKLRNQINKDEFRICICEYKGKYKAPDGYYDDNKFSSTSFDVYKKGICTATDSIIEGCAASFKTEQEALDFITLKKKYK